MGSVVATLSRRPPVTDDGVRRAIAAAPHRGSTVDVAIHGSCALGISTSADPVDAWLARTDDLAVALTGNLDNVEELAAQLHAEGRPTLSADPACVVAELFRLHGESAPSRMRGVFAAVVTDGSRLWAFRDQVGYRTLFHRVDGAGATVASEAKQVVAGSGISKEPDLAVLERQFFGNYGNATSSALSGVARLPKATILRIDGRRAETRRYWQPEALLETARYSPEEIQARFDELMTQACARTLVGPDAVSLSGGIDSPAIAAYAAPEHERRFGEPLAALTAVFPDQPAVDELDYVRIVTNELGMPLHTYERTSRPLEGLERWVDLFDNPVPVFFWVDADSHYRTARELGIRNVLNGAVAELVIDMRRYLVAHLVRTGRLGALREEIGRQRERGWSRYGVVRQIGTAFMPRSLHSLYLSRVPPRRGHRVPPWVDLAKVNERAIRDVPASRDLWRAGQVGAFTGPGLSVEANEIIQEVCGVRARYPWADVDLWEFFLSLPAEVKFPDLQTKSLVRRLLRGRVPDEILDRKDKTIFNDSLIARAEYETFRTWLIDPPVRMPGVDYDVLAARINGEEMGVFEYGWAKDLAAFHAFMDPWS